jgi:putative acetyltransferase
MPTPIVIRPYRDDDHHAVRDLFIRINRELAPAALHDRFEAYIALALREEIDRIGDYYDPARGGSFWVATEGGTLVGTYGLEAGGEGVFELRRMYVDPTRRRRGVGALLLAHAEATCRGKGAAKLVLGTSELQTAAIALYKAAGYRLVREVVATDATNKTVGGGIRRFEFEKSLRD